MTDPYKFFTERSYEDANGCWIWTRRIAKNGYGRMQRVGVPTCLAHRAAYLMFYGDIPEGMTVDHTCFQIACVNPEHFRLLTRSKNAQNQLKSKATHCKYGHAFTPENTYKRPNGSGRDCKTCRTSRTIKAQRVRRRAAKQNMALLTQTG